MTGDYLWDRTGWPDPEIVRLERVLGTLRYQPAASASWGNTAAQASVARKTPPLSFIGTLAATAAAVVAPNVEEKNVRALLNQLVAESGGAAATGAKPAPKATAAKK